MRGHRRVYRDDGQSKPARSTVGSARLRESAVESALILGMTAALVLAVLVVSSRADTVDPYDILDRHIEALGGMERLSAHESVRTKGTLDIAGLTGTVERWQGLGRTYRQSVDLGVFQETSGDDGTSVWQLDANGKVQIVEDENALLRRDVESRIAAYEAFDRGSDVFSVEYVGEGTVDGAPCGIIRITNSLNVALCASAVLYEILRRQGA